jgi:DNA-directed RNA polymerase subunit RPC12/RpoP
MTNRKWVAAAIALANDPSARVRCPVCEGADLTVRDIYPTPDADKFERYMECPHCQARNIILMTKEAPTRGTDKLQAHRIID